MHTCGIRINAKLVKEGRFRINAKLVKEEYPLGYSGRGGLSYYLNPPRFLWSRVWILGRGV